MKTAVDYQLNSGSRSLKRYKFFTPGLKPYKSKAKVIQALNFGLTVYCYDKIMKTTEKWVEQNWVGL